MLLSGQSTRICGQLGARSTRFLVAVPTVGAAVVVVAQVLVVTSFSGTRYFLLLRDLLT